MPMGAGLVRIEGGPKVPSLFDFQSCVSWLTTSAGDKWAYSFDVVHNVPELIERRGGKVKFVQSLEEHFEGGHNDHTNEVSASHSSTFRLKMVDPGDN